jgi:hypothetical protein
MANKINHRYIFLQALRTALIFISGFLTYELLKIVENKWNKKYPNHELSHYVHIKKYHFFIIFISDLLILYTVSLLFDIRL